MAPLFKYKEEDMKKAVLEYTEKGENLRQIAKKFNVPHNTLLRKAKAGVCERKMGPPTVLTSEEEKLLVKYIAANAQKGIPINKNALFESITKIIKDDNRDNPFKEGVPGKKWFTGFMKRHPEVSKRHAEVINKARASVTEASLREWHRGIKIYLEEIGHENILEDPQRILNADESGFAICPDTGLVLAPKGMKNLFTVAAGNEKDSITVLVTANAAGTIFPPLMCFAYERIPKELANNVNPDWFIGRSKSGWMTGEIFYEYVANKLIPDLKKHKIEFPVIFFVDGHKSHLTLNVAKLCEKEGIILYALYPNATHIIQPADVSIFKPLKEEWKKTVASWKLKTGNRTLTKVLFPPLLEHALNSVGEKVVANGFRKCGLYPFNPNEIDYTKCINYQESRQTDPTSFEAQHMLFFESMIPSKRLMEFKNCPSGPWQGDVEAEDLFLVWKKLKLYLQRKPNENGNIINTSPSAYATAQHSTAVNRSISDSSSEEPVPATVEVQTPGDATASAPAGIVDGESAEMAPLEDLVLTPGEVTASSLADIIVRTPTKVPDEPHEVSVLTPAASTSTNPEKPVIPKSNISPAFANHLMWPSKSPLKSQIARKKEKLPNAISSQAWVNYAMLKENAKQEMENKKKERQRKREEAKELREQKKDTQRKSVKRKLLESSDDSGSSDSSADNDDAAGLPLQKKEGEYVAVTYDGKVFPGITVKVLQGGLLVKAMQQNGLVWKWPANEDILFYEWAAVLGHLEPPLPFSKTRAIFSVPDLNKFIS